MTTRLADAVLVIAIVVDAVLVVRTALDPGWWFATVHGTSSHDPLARVFLYRAAAHWTAFLLVQILGLALWRRWPGWLLIVAGCRLSDVLTDWTYLATSPSMTTEGTTMLAVPGLLNLGMAAILVLAHREHTLRTARP